MTLVDLALPCKRIAPKAYHVAWCALQNSSRWSLVARLTTAERRLSAHATRPATGTLPSTASHSRQWNGLMSTCRFDSCPAPALRYNTLPCSWKKLTKSMTRARSGVTDSVASVASTSCNEASCSMVFTGNKKILSEKKF